MEDWEKLLENEETECPFCKFIFKHYLNLSTVCPNCHKSIFTHVPRKETK
jgi:RNA polymerase subunit RPABC4/transcription elongation factor Spt4